LQMLMRMLKTVEPRGSVRIRTVPHGSVMFSSTGLKPVFKCSLQECILHSNIRTIHIPHYRPTLGP